MLQGLAAINNTQKKLFYICLVLSTHKRWIRAFSCATHQINSTTSLPKNALMGMHVPLLPGLLLPLFKIRLFNKSLTSEITPFASDPCYVSRCSLNICSLSKSTQSSLLLLAPHLLQGFTRQAIPSGAKHTTASLPFSFLCPFLIACFSSSLPMLSFRKNRQP